MELIIDIPEEVKSRLCFGITYPKDIQVICEALNNGTSLNEVLDNIRNKITDTGAYEQETMGQTAFLNGINYCLEVIDKYRKENE